MLITASLPDSLTEWQALSLEGGDGTGTVNAYAPNGLYGVDVEAGSSGDIDWLFVACSSAYYPGIELTQVGPRVHVYRLDAHNRYVYDQVITAPSDSDDSFGVFLRLCGDKLFVSHAGGDQTNCYLCIYGLVGATWTLEQRIDNPDSGAGSYSFGISIDRNGDWLVIGSPDDASGTAFFYHYESGSWTYSSRIAGPAVSSGFGTSLRMLSDDLVAVSAPLYGDGAVYLLSRSGSTWSVGSQVLTSGATSPSYFGSDVGYGIDYDPATGTLAIGCPGASSWMGAVDFFVNDGTQWVRTQTMENMVPTAPESGNAELGEVVKFGNGMLATSADWRIDLFKYDAGLWLPMKPFYPSANLAGWGYTDPWFGEGGIACSGRGFIHGQWTDGTGRQFVFYLGPPAFVKQADIVLAGGYTFGWRQE